MSVDIKTIVCATDFSDTAARALEYACEPKLDGIAVSLLYADGLLEKPENQMAAFPDLLTFHDSPTPIENRLFVMHLKHRMRAFQGTFHNNPDYALWYGWNEMQMDLTEIKAEAEELRHRHGTR